MAKTMSAAESAEFLARRPTEAEVRAAGKILSPAEAAKLRERTGTSSSPDGKPKAPARPWR